MYPFRVSIRKVEGEFRVSVWAPGDGRAGYVRYNGPYFTDDKDDARRTGERMLAETQGTYLEVGSERSYLYALHPHMPLLYTLQRTSANLWVILVWTSADGGAPINLYLVGSVSELLHWADNNSHHHLVWSLSEAH